MLMFAWTLFPSRPPAALVLVPLGVIHMVKEQLICVAWQSSTWRVND